ncbi:anaphase promoting complex component Cut20 Apc4 like [Lecanosticta acicola]|uniref:Anaphase-promoting complex subunit 4 n=1 Tax=Lecanosticta acicola TaxID=111012 RepID=A0AAI8YTK6_9PEZI|nr:anaphase promoting complex component Cut20 Apc4 like [Lecanosticta acicola]
MASNQSHASPALSILAAKRLAQPIKFPFTAYSHTHDLLAIVTSEWNIPVFRIASGQIAFTVKRKSSDCEVTVLSWKPDGTCLGVGWSDGSYVIHDGGYGKRITEPELQVDGEEDWRLDLKVKEQEKDKEKKQVEEERKNALVQKISVIGWMDHEVDRDDGKKRDRVLTADDWYDGLAELDLSDGDPKSKPSLPNDLPRAITMLDVTRVLPRLCAIPPHGLKGELDNKIFTTQIGVDELFPPPRDLDASNRLQSLLICREDGTIQVLLDETVKLGTCRIKGRALAHTAHARSPSHLILSEDDEGRRISNVLDLPLEKLSGTLLHVIATNMKRIQGLLEYILQTVRCIEHDYESNIVVSERFLNILEGDLEDKGEGNARTNLFHLAMTGCFSPITREWTGEVLKENQTKRWDQVINTMYSCIQTHVFENLLPALERLTIAVTRLRGLAKFHEHTNKFDCPHRLLTNILDKVDCLRLVAHKMLLVCQSEHRQFRAFIKWLRMQVDIAIAEPFSASALETEQREVPNLDYSLILAFIKETLTESKLAMHIRDRPSMGGETDKDSFFEHPVIKEMSYEKAKELLLRLDSLKADEELLLKEVYDPAALLNLPAITCSLVGHVRIALKHITNWQSKMLPKPTSRPASETPFSEMTMVSSPELGGPSRDKTLSLISLAPEPNGTIRIEKTSPAVPAKAESPVSFAENSTTSTETVTIASEEENAREILDAKWIPHSSNAFLILCRDEEGHSKIYRTTTGLEQQCHEHLHTFHANAAFKPERMLAGGRKGKVLIVVFGNKGRDWRVLDLDAGVVQQEGGAEEEVIEDEMEMETGEE